ncbi:protein of unknown function [Taphrina deformans PYCC 5710]|uniref:Onanonoxo-7-onima-8-eninoihtemlysoneda n=1 Tax=Taphrina deformans (strain PYCC 5710 / ATCC 11124 / CBS 356.35 / IMI 108563 / JCM 9778 / NBRC 8474) TaxID=1097556 RepID=R4XG10_TAPDE|nr:protein of unknown function [Taphrina deformans PYCC 5710]|eukprot:CCG84650.1 protein of unknown function [Taphrina deformans PYCC 5710]
MSWRVPLAHPIYTIFGANTGVGKTIISTLLVKAFGPDVTYIKPVSTGPLSEADYLHVEKYAGVVGRVLYQFDEPCSPHIAAGQNPPADSLILQKLAQAVQGAGGPTFVESAGGVHSPGPAGSSQLDLYRPFRLPVVLVADSKLGGISTTVSAYESLRLHGYDVAALVGFKSEWGNLPYLSTKLPVPVVQLPPPPARREDAEEDAENMGVYYDVVARSAIMAALRRELQDGHEARVARLREMPGLALSKLWYPFTQHAHLSESGVTTIDSAHDDDFATFEPAATELRPVFDGSASWWTQGLGHGNATLSLEAAYAASRYGHVILPNAVNEPALALAERLLATVGRGWAGRVYYSDNGSTAMEVALKMALKASRARYGQEGTKESLGLGIIGLTGSYHGDTIGAMDASDPNIYNQEVDWYQARGLFFDPPSLLMRNGRWELRVPAQAGQDTPAESFESLNDVFDLSRRRGSEVARVYGTWIRTQLEAALDRGQRFGALIFEPILLGAGGMVFVDPLFQHLLVAVVRSSTRLCPPAPSPSSPLAAADEDDDGGIAPWTGLPVITDEVFVGLYRLSRRRSFDLLDLVPDISVNAKLLTGGVVPLATTLATESIFRTFFRPGKEEALLHGHSYTAHPVGTSVAAKSLELLDGLYGAEGDGDFVSGRRAAWADAPVWSVWDPAAVVALSHHRKVHGVLCLGSVLALTLVDEAGGYGSTVAAALVTRLRTHGARDADADGHRPGRGVMVRPLGNVVYLMASQVTTADTAAEIQAILLAQLNK